MVDAAESEAEAQNWGVAPWYYEELAKLYRKQKLYNAEVAILERFSRQRHGPGETPAKLLERLAKARSLAEKQ